MLEHGMRIGICDDEKVFVGVIEKYLKDCMANLEEHYAQVTVECFSSGEELLAAYQESKRYDLLFLDLKMKKLNGFETAGHIRLLDNKVIIIFITSLTEYVMQSFEYRPFWYLIKPVKEEKFHNVFFKALSEYASVNHNEYAFKTREEGIERINISRILYLESISRQIRLHSLDGDYDFYASINKEEIKLLRQGFVRIHKSFLVNLFFFQRVNKSNLVLKNGETLPISERRYKDVYNAYTDYLARSSL